MKMKNTGFSNLVEMLEENCCRYPKKIALVFGAKRINYENLLFISKKFASALSHTGVREFDRVCLWLPNLPEFVYSFFAILMLRAIVCPVNNMFKREEAKFILEDSGAKVIIVSMDKLEDAENILSRLDSLKSIICVSSPKNKKNILDFYTLVDTSKAIQEKIDIKKEDIAEIIYTSGTTGNPKGVVLLHKNLVANIKDCIKVIKVTKRDTFICILPLFHSFASTVCMLLPISRGSKIVIMRALKPFKRIIRSIFKNKVTIFVGIPSVYSILSEIKLSRLKLFLNYFLNPIRLCISGAASLPAPVLKKFTKKFKRPLIEGYGLTETSPVVSLNPLIGKRKPQSVGVPLPSVNIRVVDKEGNTLSPHKVGELIIKGDNVMKEYYKSETETEKALKKGWLYTGDLARIDEEGYIYIMGRLKEMINVRGLNVYPREIEDILYKHPKVKETAVVGVFHPRRGEVPVAFIVKKKNDLERKEIINYLRVNLASYKVPLKLFFKEALPKNPTGKILKQELAKEVEDAFRKRTDKRE